MSSDEDEGLPEISKKLMSARPDLIDKMNNGWNLLHCACFAGCEDTVAQILTVAPDLADESTNEGLTAMDIAMGAGHESVVIRMLCPSRVHRVGDGSTALHLAVARGLRTEVEHILSTNPATINARTSEGWTALHFAASEGHVALVELLLTYESATLINALSNRGVTALHRAAENGHLSVVKLLLAASPGLSHVATPDGWNALHVALNKGHTAVALYLLTEVPTLITTNRWSPLHLAAKRGLDEVVAHILSVDSTLVNVKIYHRTALHEAASHGHIAVAKQLLAVNPALIDMTASEDKGFTPLLLAASSGQSAMVSYLISVSPASINARTEDGCTVLHVALTGPRFVSQALVENLLARKPELASSKDHYGDTPLHLLVMSVQPREFVEAVWRCYPEALHAVNKNNDTPFHAAVVHENDCAIELFQWVLTWDEIRNAYHRHRTRQRDTRFKPVMLAQCEGLSKLLLPEVVAIVFEYLGFTRTKRPRP